jgi:hypothetical protein
MVELLFSKASAFRLRLDLSKTIPSIWINQSTALFAARVQATI